MNLFDDSLFSDTEIIDGLFLEMPKVQEIFKDATSIPNQEWREKFIEEALKVYRQKYGFADMWYLGVETVYLLPGSANIELEADELFLLVQQQTRLKRYAGNIFVFRNEDRSAVLDIQPLPNDDAIQYIAWGI